jgi:hypothetical protein
MAKLCLELVGLPAANRRSNVHQSNARLDGAANVKALPVVCLVPWPGLPMGASMLADDIADRIAIACPRELDGIIKDMWVDHTHGLLADNEMEILDGAARTRREAIQARRQAARPGTSPPPWKRATGLDSQATAVARQAGLDRFG